MPAFEIRSAIPDDAEGIARVHIRGWQEAYRHVVLGRLLDALAPEDRVDRWRGTIVGNEQVVWVALADDLIIGRATTSARDLGEHPRAVELNGPYILADCYGTGAGQQLPAAAIGTRAAFLWIAADNPRARAFYRRNGFEPDGATKEIALLDTPVATVRLVR